MKTSVVITLCSAMLGTTSLAADIERRWSVEVGGGADIAVEDLGDADLDTGFGFQGKGSYRLQPHLWSYAGWGWNRFSTDGWPIPGDADIEETGYTLGLEFIHPIADLDMQYVITLGGIYNHIEVENANGDIVADSGHELGWEVGVGLAIPVAEFWHVKPSVRYRELSCDIDAGGVMRDVNLTYVSLGVAVSRRF